MASDSKLWPLFSRRAVLLSASGAALSLSVAKGSAASAGKELVIALKTNLNNLDPVKMTIGPEYNYALAVFDGLTHIDRDMVVQPDLAESWDVSDDLTSWTFHLREGVRFHNGRELEAEDVVATMQRVLDPENGSRMRVNLSIVEKVEAIDPRTIRFTLNTPYSGLDAMLADYQGRITPREANSELSTNPIGTGPFKFVEFLPNDRLVLEKNPDYWQAGEPKVDRLVFRVIPEFASSIAALENGEIQLVSDLPSEEIDKLADSATARADEVTSGTWYAYVMRNDIPPFNDVRVRQAMFKLIDKPTITEITALGHGTPTLTPIPPSHPAYNSDLAIGAPDVEGARALLAEAGYGDGLDLVLWTPKSPVFERFAVALRDVVKAGGVNIEVRSVPDDQFFDEIEGKEPFTTTNFFGRPTPDTMLYSWFHSTGSWNANLWKFSDPEVDELLDQARQVKAVEEQYALYRKVQEILIDRGPGPVVLVLNYADGVHNSVVNYHASPRQWMDFREVDI
jgi:peptide/nickel transport system substrate-binding protein